MKKYLPFIFGVLLLASIGVSYQYYSLNKYNLSRYEESERKLTIEKSKSSDRLSGLLSTKVQENRVNEAMENINEGRIWLGKFLESMMIEDYDSASYYVGKATPYFNKADKLYDEYLTNKSKNQELNQGS